MSTAEICDEYGELDRQIRQLQPVTDRLSILKNALDGLAEGLPADQPLTISGNIYDVRLTPRRHEYSWIDKAALWRKLSRKLGALAAISLWNITFKAVCEVFGETAARELQQKEQTGYRSITACLKAPAVQQDTQAHRAA